jgi:3-dehydroquinate dehydratase-2
MKLLVLNGPNLNLLGTRETEVYGTGTLADLERALREEFAGVSLEFAQSNHEGELVDALQRAAREGFDGVVFNPAGYSHTSVALRDAVAAVDVPVVEVHISNVYARERFRHRSRTAAAAVGVIAGLGLAGYSLAVRYLMLHAAKS